MDYYIALSTKQDEKGRLFPCEVVASDEASFSEIMQLIDVIQRRGYYGYKMTDWILHTLYGQRGDIISSIGTPCITIVVKPDRQEAN